MIRGIAFVCHSLLARTSGQALSNFIRRLPVREETDDERTPEATRVLARLIDSRDFLLTT